MLSKCTVLKMKGVWVSLTRRSFCTSCSVKCQFFRFAANLTFTDSLLLWIQESFDSWTMSWTSILDLTKKAPLTSTDRPGPFGLTVMPHILLQWRVRGAGGGVCNLGWYLRRPDAAERGLASMDDRADSNTSMRDTRTMHDQMFLHKWNPLQTWQSPNHLFM